VACGAAGGNDPYDRFGLFLGIRVDDGKKQERASHTPDRVPPFLTVLDTLDKQQAIRVFEYEGCGFERDTVLRAIGLVLVFVPLESHTPTIRNFRMVVNREIGLWRCGRRLAAAVGGDVNVG